MKYNTKKEILKFYEIKPFGTKVVVFISPNPENLRKILNRNKKISTLLKKYIRYINIEAKTEGQVITDDNSKPRFIFIRNNKDFTVNLIHELVHTLDFLSEYFDFVNEKEFRAYLFEMMFTDFSNLRK